MSAFFMGTIPNGKNTALNVRTGTVPDVGGAMRDWFQPMVFTLIAKVTSAFQLVETPFAVNFQGIIQPLRSRDLKIKPEGQRAWTWYMLHADPVLDLQVDDVVNYLGVQTRVMAKQDFAIYGYRYYELCQDWEGSGP